jgi:CBS-domain-containing membrane protein
MTKTYLLRLAWIMLGSAIAISLALSLTQTSSPLLLASLGGSTLFLFGLTTTPAAQPRALFGGHILSSLIGVLAYQFFGDALQVSIIAVILTIGILLITRTTHPPAGANPLIMIQAHASFMQIVTTVLLGVVVLFIVVWIWSRIGKGGKTYPISWTQPSPATRNCGIWGD